MSLRKMTFAMMQTLTAPVFMTNCPKLTPTWIIFSHWAILKVNGIKAHTKEHWTSSLFGFLNIYRKENQIIQIVEGKRGCHHQPGGTMERDVTNSVMTQSSHIHTKIQILVTLLLVSGLQAQQTKTCCISSCLVNVPSISSFFSP